MPRAREFFTVEAGKRLKSLRLSRGLTLEQVARSLGLASGGGRAYVSRLERGAIRDPRLSTVIRYLDVVGARFSEIEPLLNRVELLPIPPEVVAEAEIDPARKPKVLAEISRDVHKYQRRLAHPAKTPPLPSAKQRRASERFRDFWMLARIVRSALDSYLITTDVRAYDREQYQQFGRRYLGAIRRYTGDKLAARLAAIEEFARVNQFKPDVCTGIRRVVDTQYTNLTRDTGHLARLRQQKAEQDAAARAGIRRRSALEPEVAARKPAIMQQANELLKTHLKQRPAFTGAYYLRVVERSAECWLRMAQIAEPGTPEFQVGLKELLRAAAASFPSAVYDPGLVGQLRDLVVRALSGLK